MFIKSIEIAGFKSYRGRMTLEFNEHINVIVGRNGSGKSNIFDAIRFVLGDVFGAMRAANGAAVLHEGTGDRLLACEVTLHLDNSDGRMPVEGNTVSVGRVVGVKKDEYFLNNKAVRKGDIVSLLESAGFSRSNPYYIVAQGKVTALTSMSNTQRLDLLKEVAGTHVYEERRKESLTVLQDANAKRAQIEDVLREMDSRIAELQAESAELAKFNELEVQKRAIEYRLYSADLAKAQAELEEINKYKDEETSATADKRKAVEDAAATLAEVETELKAITDKQRQIQADKQATTDALPRLMKKRARLAAAANDAQQRVEASKTQKQAYAEELEGLELRISSLRSTLDTELIPAEADAQARFTSVKEQSTKVTSRMEALQNKQNRYSQFKTRKERDTFLREQIENLSQQLKSKQAVHTSTVDDISALEVQLAELEALSSRQTAEIAKHKTRAAAIDGDLTVAREKRTLATQELRELFRTATEAEQECKKSRELAETAERSMHAGTPSAIRHGLEAVRGLTAEMSGIHGPLIDLFRPKHPRYNTAVDVIATNQLFNIVVDDETVATTIVEHLVAKKAGRVTLMPLSRLTTSHIEYPNDTECVPLMSLLEFKPEYKACIQQIFGRVLLCRTLDIASKYAKSHGFTCITLDGDTVSKKGAVQGGYVESDSSRLTHVAAMYEHRGRAEAAAKAKAAADSACLSKEQQVTVARGEEQKLEAERGRVRDTVAGLESDADRNKAQQADVRRRIMARKGELGAVASEISALTASVAQLQSELASEMTATLSPAEQAELATLTDQNDALYQQVQELVAALQSASQARREVETDLEENLGKRARELKTLLVKASSASAAGVVGDTLEDELVRLRMELAEATQTEEEAQSRLASLETTLAQTNSALTEVKNRADTARSTLSEAKEALDSERNKAERLLERRRAALKRKEECNVRLRDIGTIPTDEVALLEGKRRKDLIAMLSDVNEQLKGIPGVNRKAADQYAEFFRQREQLLERKTELDKGDAYIRELIQSLDMKKDEAITRTFKQIAANFQQVFSELVPRGAGSLCLLTDLDDTDEEDDAVENTSTKQADEVSPDKYRGLSVRVSFEDPSAAPQKLKKLSGGQKSLVALAFIFAIQRADPAPFYLFDEADSALDPIHRAAVANMIRQQAHSAKDPVQFVVTTFRPELATVADKWFGVTSAHKVSTVEEQDRKATLDFIGALMDEEDAVASSSRHHHTASRLSAAATPLPTTTSSAARSDASASYPSAKRLRTPATAE